MKLSKWMYLFLALSFFLNPLGTVFANPPIQDVNPEGAIQPVIERGLADIEMGQIEGQPAPVPALPPAYLRHLRRAPFPLPPEAAIHEVPERVVDLWQEVFNPAAARQEGSPEPLEAQRAQKESIRSFLASQKITDWTALENILEMLKEWSQNPENLNPLLMRVRAHPDISVLNDLVELLKVTNQMQGDRRSLHSLQSVMNSPILAQQPVEFPIVQLKGIYGPGLSRYLQWMICVGIIFGFEVGIEAIVYSGASNKYCLPGSTLVVSHQGDMESYSCQRPDGSSYNMISNFDHHGFKNAVLWTFVANFGLFNLPLCYHTTAYAVRRVGSTCCQVGKYFEKGYLKTKGGVSSICAALRDSCVRIPKIRRIQAQIQNGLDIPGLGQMIHEKAIGDPSH